jgi:hypothetical protein
LKSDIPEINTSDFVSKTATDTQIIESELKVKNKLLVSYNNAGVVYTDIGSGRIMLEDPNNTMSIFVDTDTGIKVADITDTRMYSRMVYNAIIIKSTTNSLRIDLDNISAHRFSEHNSLLSDLLFRLD